MTDKQILKRVKEYNELVDLYKAKEQECEELKNNFNIEHAELLNARSKIEELKKQIESDKYLITNAGKQNYQLVQEYDRLKVENEELKRSRDYYKRIVDGCPDVCENGFCQIDFENKRLKAENEQLKVQIKNEKQALQIDIDNLNQACLDLNQENDDLRNKLKAKEQECEELKEIIQRHDNDNNALLKEVEDELCEYYRRYIKCLAEIKEIAEENIRIADLEGLNGVYRRGLAEQILQKSSECEGNNDMENN